MQIMRRRKRGSAMAANSHAPADSGPRRRVRWTATLLSAMALVAGLQMVGAGPASADTCWVDGDGGVHCMYDGGETVGTGGGGPGGGGGGGGGNRFRPIMGDPDVPIDPPTRPQPQTGKIVVGLTVASKV